MMPSVRVFKIRKRRFCTLRVVAIVLASVSLSYIGTYTATRALLYCPSGGLVDVTSREGTGQIDKDPCLLEGETNLLATNPVLSKETIRLSGVEANSLAANEINILTANETLVLAADISQSIADVKQSEGNIDVLKETSLSEGRETETKHVAFLKVHKTGSSSVQNIFIRFGDTRNLTFILSSIKGNECGGYFHCISFTNTLHAGNILPPPTNKTLDILCSHVVYNKDRFRYYLPSDTKYISLIREPTRRLESAFFFFGLGSVSGGNLATYAKNPAKYDHRMLNNRMAFEFGFKREWFPTVNRTDLSDLEREMVLQYVEELFKDFALIMLNERLDESLILMRRMFRWNITDMVYHNKLVRPHVKLNPKDVPRVRKYLYLDYFLYDRAVKVLNMKISTAGPDFQDEVKAFQWLNSFVNRMCNLSVKNVSQTPVTVNGTKWYNTFTLTQHFCERLIQYEGEYLRTIRTRQYGDSWKKFAPTHRKFARKHDRKPVKKPAKKSAKKPI